MKTIIKLLIVAVILNAGFQAGRSYYNYYQFQQDVQQETLHGNSNTSDSLRQTILDMAAAGGHDMSADDVQIAMDGGDVIVDMKYVDNLALVPRVYTRPWPYEAHVQAHRVKPMVISPPQR